jgi:hypothetical protein
MAGQRALNWFARTATTLPKWMRVANLFLLVLIVVVAWQRRGWWLGLIALVIYGAAFVPMAVNPQAGCARASPSAWAAFLGVLQTPSLRRVPLTGRLGTY